MNEQTLLKYTFGLVPIVAGLDKFTNILTDWSQYLSSGFQDLLPFDASTFMIIVGIIEIVAGIIVLVKTKIGAIIVALWLALIALTLIFSGHYLDVAVRDLVMAIAAYVLFKLSS
ncbi:DoxX family membrane protein [Hwangdonia lutea]|uniref:DoxX family membrane protein n=1 Tax=Hwangdonia lutea TaxID=3075823 RepID=A0AA97EMR7_9FLAO|nr:DoxX family membrane protein [Hwangdonia sp. SCSIO 19198]WOD44276.1 DoxX family membrane protein [Hwangdonia sp. SCSIO 19198]